MKDRLRQILNQLNYLDSSRMTIVTYHPVTMELILHQNGTVVARLNNLVGYMKPVKHWTILLPEDLQQLKASLKYILDDIDSFLIAPIKNGYRIWEMGDTSYTSSPRFLTDLKFSSISARPYLWILKLTSEEARILYRRFGKVKINTK